jgi:hypothetical protein
LIGWTLAAFWLSVAVGCIACGMIINGLGAKCLIVVLPVIRPPAVAIYLFPRAGANSLFHHDHAGGTLIKT